MSDESPSLNASTTRREFAKAAVVAVAAPVLAPLAACAHPQPAPAPAPAAAAAPVAAPASPVAPSAPPQQGERQAPDPMSIHLAEALKTKYRDRLNDEQWEEVRKGIEGNLRAARALRNFELPITTEPAFVFRAWRGGDR